MPRVGSGLTPNGFSSPSALPLQGLVTEKRKAKGEVVPYVAKQKGLQSHFREYKVAIAKYHKAAVRCEAGQSSPERQKQADERDARLKLIRHIEQVVRSGQFTLFDPAVRSSGWPGLAPEGTCLGRSVARRKRQTRFGGASKYFLCYGEFQVIKEEESPPHSRENLGLATP